MIVREIRYVGRDRGKLGGGVTRADVHINECLLLVTRNSTNVCSISASGLKE